MRRHARARAWSSIPASRRTLGAQPRRSVRVPGAVCVAGGDVLVVLLGRDARAAPRSPSADDPSLLVAAWLAITAATAPVTTASTARSVGGSRATRPTAGRFDQARLMIAQGHCSRGATDRADRAIWPTSPSRRAITPRRSPRYQQLLARSRPTMHELLERAGIAALRPASSDRAESLIDRATRARPARPGGRGTHAACSPTCATTGWRPTQLMTGRRACRRTMPKSSTTAAGRGCMRGDWAARCRFFEQAAQLDPKSTRIANNLRACPRRARRRPAQAPTRRKRPRLGGAAERCRGRRAESLGDKQARGRRLHPSARSQRRRWYERAANNLEGG